ncbi:hypothetical protein FRC19_006461 [Serendipita sp. 401]|nr:hypothetical protein FRC19_006461 [Serendipita sp. 401]
MSTAKLNPNDKVIIVMGPTGAGKSTFINHAIKGSGDGIGHGLRSQTRAIRVIRPPDLTSGDRPIVFVDTPGLDDTDTPSIEVLGMISEFLIQANKDKIPVERILYLHRISDNRMAGSILRELRVFKGMCGDTAIPSVVLVTTMWSLVNKVVGEARLSELKETFWKEFRDAGCKFERFEDSEASARQIAFGSTENGEGTALDKKEPMKLLIVSEIVEKGSKLTDTVAGTPLEQHLQTMVHDEREGNRRLKQASKGVSNPAPKKIAIKSEIQVNVDKEIRDAHTLSNQSIISQPENVTAKVSHVKKTPIGQNQIELEIRLEIDFKMVINI